MLSKALNALLYVSSIEFNKCSHIQDVLPNISALDFVHGNIFMIVYFQHIEIDLLG